MVANRQTGSQTPAPAAPLSARHPIPYLSPPMTTPKAICAGCGTAIAGSFCPGCGASTSPGVCRACRATLSPGARFCHRCGVAGLPAVAVGKERRVWTLAGLAVALTIGLIAYKLGRGQITPPTVAAMGNAGNAGAAGAVRAPDITKLSPRERFDRLFDRVIRAAEAQSPDTVAMFSPMALGAYQQLDQVDTDARYHAAMIHLVLGQFPEAKALADTILKAQPTHLLGFLIRGEVAEQQKDPAALTAAYRAFLAGYDAEIKTDRQEYSEHKPVLDDFRTRALARHP